MAIDGKTLAGHRSHSSQLSEKHAKSNRVDHEENYSEIRYACVDRRDERREARDQMNIRSYQILLTNLSSFLTGKTSSVFAVSTCPNVHRRFSFRTWRQQEIAAMFMQQLLQRDYPIPPACIGTITDLLVHENHLLRKVRVELHRSPDASLPLG